MFPQRFLLFPKSRLYVSLNSVNVPENRNNNNFAHIKTLSQIDLFYFY